MVYSKYIDDLHMWSYTVEVAYYTIGFNDYDYKCLTMIAYLSLPCKRVTPSYKRYLLSAKTAKPPIAKIFHTMKMYLDYNDYIYSFHSVIHNLSWDAVRYYSEYTTKLMGGFFSLFKLQSDNFFGLCFTKIITHSQDSPVPY